MKRKSFLAYPYVVWSAIFVIIPLILVVFLVLQKNQVEVMPLHLRIIKK